MARKTFTIGIGASESNAIRLNAFERPVAFITGSVELVGDDIHIAVGESSSATHPAYWIDGTPLAFTHITNSRFMIDNTEMHGGAYYKLHAQYEDGTSATQDSVSVTVYMETREFNW